MSTALIIGAGARVGQAVADGFAEAGYQVAVASRSGTSSTGYKHFPLDASDPTKVAGLFSEVRKAVGIPSVVVYNAYGAHMNPPEDPFKVTIDELSADFNVNGVSVYAAAAEAVKGFEELKSKGELGSGGGTFIFTGNILNDTVSPSFVTFGMSKGAGALLIKSLALVSYKDLPYKFYFGDQRHPDGQPMPTGLSGPAHAEEYLKLAKQPEQGPWQYTFVEGEGYKEFPKVDVWYPN